MGGKVVIQAKRYKNTVGVSAVRGEESAPAPTIEQLRAGQNVALARLPLRDSSDWTRTSNPEASAGHLARRQSVSRTDVISSVDWLGVKAPAASRLMILR